MVILPCPRFDRTATKPICRWKYSSKKGNSYSAYLIIEVHIDMESKKDNTIETQMDQMTCHGLASVAVERPGHENICYIWIWEYKT